MNILELGVAPGLGGLELYFHRCCRELITRGHSVMSVRLKGSRLEELAEKDDIPSYALNGVYKFLPFGNARKIARLISERKIDIVHAHLKDNLLLIVLAKVFSERPFKLVFTRQMPIGQSKRDPYHRWLYTRIDLFLTITEQLKRDCLKFIPLPASRIRRLYYGVPKPPPRDEELIRKFLTISKPGDFNIGVFSRLEHQKGQHLVVHASKILRERRIPVKLYIVGDVMNEEYKESLVQQIEAGGMETDVIFKGFLSQPMLAMMALDALVLPSRNEAFGLVLVEAMRCGVAVLGVNAGGVPEIIDDGETGILFEWDDPHMLAAKLEDLYKDPLRREELAQRGKRKADEQFDNKGHFDKLESLFVETLNGN